VVNAMKATTLPFAKSVPVEAIHHRRLEVALRVHERELARIDKGDGDAAARQVHEMWIRLGRDPAISRLIHDIVRDPDLAAELRRDHRPIFRKRGIRLPEGTVVHVIDRPSRYPSVPTQRALRFEFTVTGIRCAAEWDPDLGFSGETLSAPGRRAGTGVSRALRALAVLAVVPAIGQFGVAAAKGRLRV
jgi:hypothetical protein